MIGWQNTSYVPEGNIKKKIHVIFFYVFCSVQKRLKAAEAESKLKQVYIPN